MPRRPDSAHYAFLTTFRSEADRVDAHRRTNFLRAGMKQTGSEPLRRWWQRVHIPAAGYSRWIDATPVSGGSRPVSALRGVVSSHSRAVSPRGEGERPGLGASPFLSPTSR